MRRLHDNINDLQIHLVDLNIHIHDYQDNLTTWAEDNGVKVDVSFSIPDKPFPKIDFVKDIVKIPLDPIPKQFKPNMKRFEEKWVLLVKMHTACEVQWQSMINESARLKAEQSSINAAIDNYNVMAKQNNLTPLNWKNEVDVPTPPPAPGNLPPFKIGVKQKK